MANTCIPGCGFHHLALRVRDFDKSYKFYTETLGFQLRTSWGEGDGRVALLDLGDGGYLELFAGRTTEEAQGIFWHVALKVDDVDAAYARAMAAGCEDTARRAKRCSVTARSRLPCVWRSSAVSTANFWNSSANSKINTKTPAKASSLAGVFCRILVAAGVRSAVHPQRCIATRYGVFIRSSGGSKPPPYAPL